MAKKVEQALIFLLIIALYCAAFALPILAVILLLPMVCGAYYAYSKRWYISLVPIVLYSVAAFAFNYDDLLFIIVPTLVIGFTVTAVSVEKLGKYKLGASLAAGGFILACVLSVMTLGLARGKSGDELVKEYVASGKDNVIVTLLAERAYEKGVDKEHRLGKSDENYTSAALEYYGNELKIDAAKYLLYYLTGFGAEVGIGAYLLCLIMRRKLSSASGAKERTPIKLMRLDRKYLLACVLPALVFSLVGLIPDASPLVATVFNLLVTVPCAYAGLTLIIYAAALFKGKARIPAFIVAALILVACGIFPIGTLVLSAAGFGDAAIPLRPLMDLAAN